MSTSRNRRRHAAVGLAAARAVQQAGTDGGPALHRRIGAVPGMIGATARGDWDGWSRRSLFATTLGALYLVMPFDLFPEGLLGVFGLGDDLTVAAVVAGGVLAAAGRFVTYRDAVAADRVVDAR